MIRYGIMGCGGVGRKRAQALAPGKVVACHDLDPERQAQFAEAFGVRPEINGAAMLAAPDVDAIIVATVNADLMPLSRQALLAGKHVLVEKPGAIQAADLEELRFLSQEEKRVVHVGYNHRYHPAFREARRIFESGVMGPLLMVRAHYGHGGRVGYDREWRADPVIAGGGEMIDQGVHLIDLARWFLGDFTETQGHLATLFWDMPVEDNVFLNLRTAQGQVAWLHASCTEWKNCFSFELYGRTGKVQIEGLGGSYGKERLTYYQMKPEMGVPEAQTWEYSGADESWRLELEEFEREMAGTSFGAGNLQDAIEVLKIVENVYQKKQRL